MKSKKPFGRGSLNRFIFLYECVLIVHGRLTTLVWTIDQLTKSMLFPSFSNRPQSHVVNRLTKTEILGRLRRMIEIHSHFSKLQSGSKWIKVNQSGSKWSHVHLTLSDRSVRQCLAAAWEWILLQQHDCTLD